MSDCRKHRAAPGSGPLRERNAIVVTAAIAVAVLVYLIDASFRNAVAPKPLVFSAVTNAPQYHQTLPTLGGKAIEP